MEKKYTFRMSRIEQWQELETRIRKIARREKAAKFEVAIQPGVCFMPKTWEINGLKNVTFSSPGRVIMSGGKIIENIKRESVAGTRLWTFPAGKRIYNLWKNGKRISRTRYPKKSYLKVKGLKDKDKGNIWKEPSDYFIFYPGALRSWKNCRDGELILLTRWVESRLPIARIDEENYQVHFTKKSTYKPEPDDLYYLENILEFLEPGECYCADRTDRIYYYPEENERIEDTEIVIGSLAHLVKLKNCQNIKFKSLIFSHSNWYYSPNFKEAGFRQAGWGIPAAVCAEKVVNTSFEHCEFSHLGGFGLELGRGCQHNRIVNCRFFDLAAGGIKIGETIIRERPDEQTCANEIRNCVINDGGLIFPQAVGIWVGQSYRNKIVGNQVSNFFYTGISVGWTWGYAKSLAYQNVIANNFIHHIGKKEDGTGPILSDMGGVYTLGIQPGTVIKNNILYRIAGYKYGGWGIYFDEGSSHIRAEKNCVLDTTHGGFHQHYGKGNIVRNNVFAFGRDAQAGIGRGENHLRLTFENNLVVGKSEKFLAGILASNLEFRKNIYVRLDRGEAKFGEHDWEKWQEKGLDKNSVYISLGGD